MAMVAEMLDIPVRTVRRTQAETVIAAMARRGIGGEYHEEIAPALESIRSRISQRAVVAFGGSVSLVQSGLLDMLRGMEVDLLDRSRPGLAPAAVEEMRVRGGSADVYFSSVNAVTADGRIVCIDGSGNRVGSILYGPRQVILLAGTNKIVASLDDAMSRVRNHAAPLNAVRLGKDTPCARTGFCDESSCAMPGRICGQVMVVEMSRTPGRMHIVFVGADLGF
jgi:hypothetical protein